MKLWGGRFERAPSKVFEDFSRSLRFDGRLFFADVEGNRAWARALWRAGIYSADEADRVCALLEELSAEARANPAFFDSLSREADEDVHTFVLRKLAEKEAASGQLPSLAGRLHTGRSRNEQVSLDLRLWMKQETDAAVERLDNLLDALVSQAERHPGLTLPGYTHLRRAQPVLWAHYLLAYFQMFVRDRARLLGARESADAMPLGSGALAGSGLPIGRQQLARDLGFSRITENSLDAASDRDFALEFLFAASTTFLHLSRLAEDWILYSSEEFGFLELSDEVTSGSSLMPQKKNPDALELLRGKAGRVLGDLVALATVVKGLPLTYNRDLQEDKEAIFDAADQLRGGLEMATLIVATVDPKSTAMATAAAGGWTCATDLAEYLALKGVPFREAHEIVGHIVRASLSSGRPPESWTLEELSKFSPKFDDDCLPLLRGTTSTGRREIPGGTGPRAVAQALQEARKWLEELRPPAREGPGAGGQGAGR